MTPDAPPEATTDLHGRARTYGFLSALFAAPPSPAVVDLLWAGTFLAESGLDAEGPAAADLAALAHASASAAELARELTAEYTRLFVLPMGIRPHESAILDNKKKLGGAVTMGVRRFYEHAAAEVLPSCLELPDHVGVELEFMHFLCTQEAHARERGLAAGVRRSLELQHDFLRDHLLRWAFNLCAQLQEATSSGFYRNLAGWTEDFLRAETREVPRLLAEAGGESQPFPGVAL